MHCASCSTLIDSSLNKAEGVKKANVNLTTNKATVEFDEKKTNIEKLIQTIKNKGYGASEEKNNKGFNSENKKEIKDLKNKFYISLVFSIPVFILGMFFMKNPIPYKDIIMWVLATPVQFFVAKNM